MLGVLCFFDFVCVFCVCFVFVVFTIVFVCFWLVLVFCVFFWFCCALFFVYVFVNIGMVSGLLPVVGVPLPLISYGGTSMVTLLAAFGVIMSVGTHKRILAAP